MSMAASALAVMGGEASQTSQGQTHRTVFYPADYGTFDPLGVLGSLTAIQNAGNAASAAGGGDVDLGYGTILVPGTLNMEAWSDVRLIGHGPRATILKLVPGADYSAGVLVSSPFVFGNHLLDFTLDCNGSNGVVIGAKPIVAASSRARIRIELCNWAGTVESGIGANISGTVGIQIAGHDVDLSDTYVHDTYRWQIMTTSPIGNAGATTAALSSVAGLSYVSGANGNQTLVIDPSVNAVSELALTGGTTPAIVPITANDNPLPGAGMTTGMTGIYVGQQIQIGYSSGTHETVTVQTIGVSAFVPAAPLQNSYPAGTPITYTGATETVQLGGVSGSTITFATATQLNHAANVAIVAYAQTYDAIAVVGWSLGNLYATDIRYLHGRAERLGEDPIGLAVGQRITIADFHALDCASGIALTDAVSGNIHDVIVNNTFNGQFPSSIASPGQIWSGVYVVGGAPPSSAGTQPPTWDGLNIHDIEVNGYARGIVVAGSATNPIRDVRIHHPRLNGQGMEAIYLSGCSQTIVDHPQIRNPNASNLATDAGLSVAGIIAVGTAVAPITDLLIDQPSIVDDRGSHQMRAGIQLYGSGVSADASDIRIRGGRISGSVGNPIQIASMAAGTYSIRDVDGYNPVVAPTAPVTSPSTGAWNQNTTGVDCYIQITQAGVGGTHLYVNSSASTTGAKDYGANTAWPAMLFVPANAYFQFVFTTGTITLGWQGN